MVSFILFSCWRLPVRSCLFYENWCHLDYNILFVHKWKFLGVVLIGFNFCPTLWHNVFFDHFSCKDGVFRKYQGARTKEDFLSFVDEQKWEAVEPVSSWFGPSSILWVFLWLLLIQIISQIRYYAVNISDYLTQKVLSDKDSGFVLLNLFLVILQVKYLFFYNTLPLFYLAEWIQCLLCSNSPCLSG